LFSNRAVPEEQYMLEVTVHASFIKDSVISAKLVKDQSFMMWLCMAYEHHDQMLERVFLFRTLI
jgi:hypothetical protein